MEDTCSPGKNKRLQPHRFYSIVAPAAVLILILESFYIISNIPGNLGSAFTIKGTLPPVPSAPLNSKKL